MAQTVLITLTLAGADTGPFDLYSNVDGYALPFEDNVPKPSLQAGYTSTLVPDVTTTIRVKSDNPLCNNYVDLPIMTTTTTTTAAPTTTTTTTAPATTTTTTTSAPATTTTTTTAAPLFAVTVYGKLSEALSSGNAQIQWSLNQSTWTGLGLVDVSCTLRGTVPDISSGTTVYFRVINQSSVTITFGFGNNTSVCPAIDTLCIASTVVTGNKDVAITVRVVSGASITC